MLRFFASACLLASLPGCAAPPAHPIQAAIAKAAPATTSRDFGTILAVRPVPERDPQPVRVVLQQLGGSGAASGTEEIIVRSDTGETLAVVQPDAPTLRPGARVAILRGLPTLLSPLPASAVVPGTAVTSTVLRSSVAPSTVVR